MKTNRREFLQKTSLGTTGLLILGSSSIAFSCKANDKMNVAIIGLGFGSSYFDKISLTTQNLVAVCDINLDKMNKYADRIGGARRYQDYRLMLDEMNDQLDAVMIATPQHSLTGIAMEAMKSGKHVYCEKPLSHEVAEARSLRHYALEHKEIVTQMGNQGVATDSYRRILEQVQQGAIGEIREVHIWFDNSGQGIHPWHTEMVDIPDNINWDVFLGSAPNRPYHPEYVTKWRQWREYGTGMLGEGASHSIHMTFRSLNIGSLWQGEKGSDARIRVEAEVPFISSINYPDWENVTFDIPARGSMPPVRIYWHLGSEGHLRERGILQKLEGIAGTSLDWGKSWAPTCGSLLIGSKGVVHTNPHNSLCRILPEQDFTGQGGSPQVIKPANKSAPTGIGNAPNHHLGEWVEGCKNRYQPYSNFIDASPAIEMLMLGNIATMIGKPLEFDPVSGRITNNEEADRAISTVRRKGWEI